MSVLEQIERVNVLKLILVGIIGFAWLSVLMVMVVGTVAVLATKSWLPKTIEQAMGQYGDVIATFGRRSASDDGTEVEVSSDEIVVENEHE